MFPQEDSVASWALARDKHPAPARLRNRGERKKGARGVVTGGHKVLLFGRLRELALYRAEVLRHNGFTVLTPRDKAEAIAAVENGGFGAAILSYTLPSDTVEELAELVKQKCPECALITISQTGQVDRKIGPDEIVIADEGPAALLKALDRIMRHRLQ